MKKSFDDKLCDFIVFPATKLENNKYKIIRFLGNLLVLPWVIIFSMIIIPLIIVALTIETYKNS